MHGGVLFFSLFAALANPGRFVSLFYRSFGLSDSQIGIVLSGGYVLSALTAGPISAKADQLKERELFSALCFGAALSAFVMQSAATLLPSQAVFPFLAIMAAAVKSLDASTYPLVVAMSLTRLKKKYGQDAHERFGRHRLWGAVSWAIVALSLGIIADKVGSVAYPAFLGRAFFGALFIISTIMFRIDRKNTSDLEDDQVEEKERIEEEEIEGSETESTSEQSRNILLVALRTMMAGGAPSILFYTLIFTLSVGMSLVEGLLFLFFEKDLKASNSLDGLSVVVTVIFEIPMFALAPQLLRLMGSKILLSIGAFAFVLRGFGYTMVPKAWMVLFFEPFHGVTYASMAIAAVSFVSERSPPHLEATSQALLSTLRTIGSVVGTAFGGYIMEHFGSRTLYRSAAIIVFISAVTFLVVDYMCKGSDEVSEDDENLLDEKSITDI